MTRTFLHIIGFFLLICSCEKKEEKVPVAQVGDKFLYIEDVGQTLPKALSKADSVLWVNDFIENWIRKELVVLSAEQNLTFEQKDVHKELEEYKNSLLTYRYKKELMLQKMDTILSDEEIENYYQQNKQQFILNKNIVKAMYLKTPLEVSDPETIKNLSLENDPVKMAELDDYCIRYAKSYDRFNDKWVDIERILTQLPVEITNQERFLRRNKYMESKDTDYYYFICIRDFRLSGDQAPTEYVESQIKNLLLNQRKIRFLKQIEKDIYEEGVATKKFKIFNVQK